MRSGSVDYYWLSAGGAGPPLGLADITWRKDLPEGGALLAPSVMFLDARKADSGELLQQVRARFGERACLVVLLAVCKPDQVEALLDQGADDVCSALALRRPATLLARARHNALRRACVTPSKQLDYLRTGLDALPIPLFFKDAQAAYLGCNKAFQAALGRRAEEIVGKTVYQTAHPDMAESYAQADRQLLEVDGTQIFDSIHRFNDGSLHDVSVVKAVFRDGNGEIAGFAGAMLDITRHKRAEAALQESELRYREVFEHASDAIFITDVAADGRFKFAGHNPAAERVFKFATAESIGKYIDEFVPPQIASRATRRYRECLSAGAATRYEESLELLGGIHWFVFNLIPIRTEGGTIHRILGIGRDVTDERLLERVRRERELEFRTFIEDSPDVIVRYDRTCRRTYVNSAYRANCSIPVEQVLGKTPRQFGPFAAAEAERYERALLRVLETALPEEIEVSILGGEMFQSIRIFPDRNTTGEITGVLTISRDVTDRVRAEQRLEQREQEFRTLVENTPDTIARYDRQCRRLYVNPALARTLRSEAALLGRTPAEGSTLVDPDQYIAKLREVFDNAREREYECASLGPDGDTKWQLLRFVPEYDQSGEVVTVLAIGRDITEIIENRSKIQRMAFSDALTGLPNRSLLNDCIQKLAAEARASGRQFGLMMLDLDRFKEVNDTLGHAAGDALLCEVAARLRACVRGADVVARLGGDEFAILLPNTRRRADLSAAAERILRSLAKPFHIGGHEIIVTTSIGITKSKLDGTDVDTLFKQADSAMYRAKRMGRNNFQFFHKPEMTGHAVQRLPLEKNLRKACPRSELEPGRQKRSSQESV